MTASETTPRLDHVTCASPAGVHRMAYWEWGDPDNDQVLVCVHGLTRTGRDFDILARRMCQEYRVVCPDVVGRGKSDWLVDANGYVIPQYVADMITLLARLNPARLDWVGTSMGGLIGMVLGSTLQVSPSLRPPRVGSGLGADSNLRIGRMVLNDVGPALNFTGLSRIAQYVGTPGEFAAFEDAVKYVSTVSAGFGPHDQAGWEDLTRHVVVRQGNAWVKHYDLRIAQPFALQNEAAMQTAEVALWAAWESLQCPLLLLRGEQSDLLTDAVAREMLERNGQAQLHTVAGVGHAPSLRSDDQLDVIERFLRAA